MLEDRGEVKKKGNVKYNVLVVPDTGTEAVKQFSVNMQVIKTFVTGIALLMIAALLYCVILTRELNESKNNILVLEVQVSDLTRQNEWLITQKAEQKEELTKVSAALDDKVEQEKEREAEIAKSFIPSGFPLTGKASYSENEKELEGNPVTWFEAAQGTSVIATANGTVSSIAGSDATGYIVMVDHGNGYFTVYRNSAQPKVKEGDAVTTETELFKIELWNGKLGYQIIENEAYIDPLSLMEISG
ncbi:MAG: M23 family metallopeptidase [Lachnospiraceae bacterium]|nr:M23 family metallopeptidase [Lachnospiraceae bacterium]